MPTAGESSLGTGPTSPATRTYERSLPQHESMFSLEASHARTSVQLVNVPGLQASAADYGLSSPVSFASFDPDTCSWRTSQGSFLEGWAEFSATWPMSGMTRSGIAYRRRPSAPRIFEPESSFWPTPVADGDRETVYAQGGIPLGVAARRWPTPTARDSRTLRGAQDRKRDGGPSLAQTMLNDGHSDGRLNPTWVEWLMGFPTGWTDCADSGTPLSPRSQSGSDAA